MFKFVFKLLKLLISLPLWCCLQILWLGSCLVILFFCAFFDVQHIDSNTFLTRPTFQHIFGWCSSIQERIGEFWSQL